MYTYIALALALLGFSLTADAGDIDVYGLDKNDATKLLNTWGKAIYQTEKMYWKQRLAHQLTPEDERAWQKTQQDFIAKIKQRFESQTVLIESVYYPDTNNLFTTISLDKMPLYQPPTPVVQARTHPDVLDKLLAFIPKATQFVLDHPEYTNALNCLDYHCITPEHPYFKADLSYFRDAVPRQQDMILEVLNHSADISRRRAAIFALGYLKHPQTIVNVLERHLNDPSTFIRHDCLRVYGELLAKAPEVKVDIDKILPCLFSVYEAERNKTLIVLLHLVKQNRYKRIIAANASNQLWRLKDLKQPNNHDLACQILATLGLYK